MKWYFASCIFFLLLITSNSFVVTNTNPKALVSKKISTSSSSSFSSKKSTTKIDHTGNTKLSLSINTDSLAEYALTRLIDVGVPAAVVGITSIFIIGAIGKSRDRSKKEQFDDSGKEFSTYNPARELYDDLYGSDQQQGPGGGPGSGFPAFPFGGPGPNNGKNKQKYQSNMGIPSKQYIKITNINDKLNSYQYSMVAATQSKALAASQIRDINFEKAILKGVPTHEELTNDQCTSLLKSEKDFLKKGSKLLNEIQNLELSLATKIIDDEINAMKKKTEDVSGVIDVTPSTNDGKEKEETKNNKKKKDTDDKSSWNELSKLNRELEQIELNFVKDVIHILGPKYAMGIRNALLGDIATRGIGNILTKSQQRPLTSILGIVARDKIDEDGNASNSPTTNPNKSLYVTQFPGDVTASQVKELREEVTAIIRNAKSGVDEALIVLQSGGGTVTGYGLAAAQLQRFKEANIKLTICVEQVAASGGYMMCCVADKIIASPFAVLGSIGVISEIPNVYKRLKKEGIEFQTVTAGKYKRTLTPTKKVTKEDLDKSTKDLEDILKLFREFVYTNRPSLDIDNVATGETWLGTNALEKGLCDEIATVDDVITSFVDDGYNVYDVKYELPALNPQEQLQSLLPFGSNSNIFSSTNDNNIIRNGIRWLVRTIGSEIQSEILSNTYTDVGKKVETRYMARDNTSDRVRAES